MDEDKVKKLINEVRKEGPDNAGGLDDNKQGGFWSQMLHPSNNGIGLGARSRLLALIAGMLFILLGLGASAWLLFVTSRQEAETPEQVLDQITRVDLPNGSIELGESDQTLAVSASAFYRNTLTAEKDMNVKGNLNVAGVATVSSLNVVGQLDIGDPDNPQNFEVFGSTTIQGSLSVGDQLNVGGSMSVNGNLTVSNAIVNGDLTVRRRIVTAGASPVITKDAKIGGAGTVSISGNDIAGTVVINIPAGVSVTGILANVSFSAPFTATPKVILSPVGSATGALGYYVTRTNSGFSIGTATPTFGGASYVFDYHIMQ